MSTPLINLRYLLSGYLNLSGCVIIIIIIIFADQFLTAGISRGISISIKSPGIGWDGVGKTAVSRTEGRQSRGARARKKCRVWTECICIDTGASLKDTDSV